MLLFKNKLLLLSFFLVFASCNSVPLYTAKSEKNLIGDNIIVNEIDGEIGFYLNQALRISLNNTIYKKSVNLVVEISLANNEYGISSSNQFTRKDLIATINCSLKRNNFAHNFSITERVSFDINKSNVANKAAEQNAKKRLANLLSTRILAELNHSNLIWLK